MKNILNSFVFVFLMSFNSSCYAQQMMKTVDDAQKLQTNKNLFIGKSLGLLLKEIKPEIKLVIAEGNRADGALSYIVFKFVDREGQKKYNKENKASLGITVFLKEKFEWDKSKVPVSEREKWTNADAKKYENLTVADIRVYGSN